MKKEYLIIKKDKDKDLKTDSILKALGIFLLLFIVSIEVMFYICGSIPDSLVIGVLGSGGTECICCLFVFLIKKKYKRPDEKEEMIFKE